MKELSTEAIAKTMKISDNLATLNYNRYQSFDELQSKQAIYAFKGEVYRGLKIEEFDEEEVEFTDRHLRILSGLYGILNPLDHIKEYRLEMGIKVSINESENLYEFWKDKLTETIKEEVLEAPGEKVLINLASEEYSKSIDFKALRKSIRVINITFKENRNGQYKVIGTYSKKARGLMASYIMRNKIDKIEKIKGFSKEGYSYNLELSSEENIIFTR